MSLTTEIANALRYTTYSQSRRRDGGNGKTWTKGNHPCGQKHVSRCRNGSAQNFAYSVVEFSLLHSVMRLFGKDIGSSVKRWLCATDHSLQVGRIPPPAKTLASVINNDRNLCFRIADFLIISVARRPDRELQSDVAGQM